MQRQYHPELGNCTLGELADYSVKVPQRYYPSQFQIVGRKGGVVQTDRIGSRYSDIGGWTVPKQFEARENGSGVEFRMVGIDVGDATGVKVGPLLDWGPRALPPCKIAVEVRRIFDGGIFQVPERGIKARQLRLIDERGRSRTYSTPLRWDLRLKEIVGGGSSRYYSYVGSSNPFPNSPPCQ